MAESAESLNGSYTNGPYKGLPQWAKVAAIIGFPGAMAFLVFFAFYQLTGSAAQEHQTVLATHVTESKAQDVRMEQFMTAHEKHEELVRQILQQICVLHATTAAERRACIPVSTE